MCGICGIIKFNKQFVYEAPLRKMMQIMMHRGPDDEGIFIEKNVGMGFVRLSIIDLSKAGNQPMVSNDGRYVIVFNGEIYNYIEIREDLKQKGCTFRTNSDTEVLLASYKEWGEACLHRFNGMWAFVVYDRAKKKYSLPETDMESNLFTICIPTTALHLHPKFRHCFHCSIANPILITEVFSIIWYSIALTRRK